MERIRRIPDRQIPHEALPGYMINYQPPVHSVRYNDRCSVCTNMFDDNQSLFLTNCEHLFHEDCFKPILLTAN